MERELEFVAEAVRQIEAFYPEFLEKTGAMDNPLARTSFYAMMIPAVESSPYYDQKAAVLEVLKILLENAQRDLKKLFPFTQ